MGWYGGAPSGGGSGTPGGSPTQIQYNNSGSFGGVPNTAVGSNSVYGTTQLETDFLGGVTDPNTFLRFYTNVILGWAGGNVAWGFGNSPSLPLNFPANYPIAWNAFGGTVNGTLDTFLGRDGAAGTLSLRNSTNSQTLLVYNTTDGALPPTNYERGILDWRAFSGAYFTIGTQAGGTGTAKDLNLSAATSQIKFFQGWGHLTHVYTTQHGLEFGYGGTSSTQPNIVFFADNTIAFGGADAASPTPPTLTFQNVAGPNNNQTYGPPTYIQPSLGIAQGGSTGLVIMSGFQGSPPTGQTATITIGATAGINIPYGSIWPQQPFFFTTTGALPTGLTPLTTYFSVNGDNPGQNFDASVSYSGGSAIATSGTQSGVHTIHFGAQCTISNASPAVITLVPAGGAANYGHCLCSGMVVQFSANGGTLPTGITAGTNYYVTTNGINSTQFTVATTLNGGAIGTSSAGSGTFTYEIQSSQLNLAPYSQYPDGSGIGYWFGPAINNQSLYQVSGFANYGGGFQANIQWANNDYVAYAFNFNIVDVSPTTKYNSTHNAQLFGFSYSFPTDTSINAGFAGRIAGDFTIIGHDASINMDKPNESYTRLKLLVSGTADGNGAPFIDSAVIGMGTGAAPRDLALQRDDVGILGIFNWSTKTNPTAIRVYNTYTDNANYERGVFDWTTNTNQLTIGAQKGGTGTYRQVNLYTFDGAWGSGNLGIQLVPASELVQFIDGSGAVTTAISPHQGIQMANNGSIGWGASGAGSALDVAFARVSAGLVSLYHGNTLTSPTGLVAYNTTDAGIGVPTNYERAVFDWTTTANVLSIGTQAGGTGTLRNLRLLGPTADGTNILAYSGNLYGASGFVSFNSGVGFAYNNTTYVSLGVSSYLLPILHLGDPAGNVNGGWLLHCGEARVTSDVVISSTTTLANVAGLSVNLQAGRTYAIDVEIFYTVVTTAGIQLSLGGTATVTNLIWDGWIYDSNTLKGQFRGTALGATGVNVASTTATTGHGVIRATFTVNAAGTVTVMAANGTSTASGTTIKQGSRMLLQDIQ